MQWTIEEVQNWEELRTFVDTALLPLYLYQPTVEVPEHVKKMTYLMKMASAIEQRLRGRLLLLPMTYQVGEERVEQATPPGFAFYFALRFSGQPLQLVTNGTESAIEYLTISDEDLDSEVRYTITVDILYQTILKTWQKHQ